MEINIRNDIVPSLGRYPISLLDHEVVQDWVNDLVDRGLAPSTVRKAFHCLSAIMEAAVTAGRISKSPCGGIWLPKPVPQSMRFLTAEDLHFLAAEHQPRYRALVLTAGYLGPRWSELVPLTPSDVSLLHRRMTISHALVEVQGRLVPGKPKSFGSTRTITIPDFLVGVLEDHLAEFPPSHGFVFSSPQGGPVRRYFRTREFVPAVNRAGLAPLHIHDLRHTAAGLAISMGAHPKVIQEGLGHASIRTTLDTYGHPVPQPRRGTLPGSERPRTNRRRRILAACDRSRQVGSSGSSTIRGPDQGLFSWR